MTDEDTVFSGARLLTGDARVVDEATIHVRNGVIAAAGRSDEVEVPLAARRVDLSGKTVMPTIINPHGHIGYLKEGVSAASNFCRENVLDHLHRLAYYGVSVFQSLGTDRDDTELQIRDEQAAGRLPSSMARLFSASDGLVAPTPGEVNGGPYFATDVVHEVSEAPQARAAVRRLAQKRPDFIKFWVDDRRGTKAKLAPEVYAALIDEAHRLGLKTIAHTYILEDAKGVVRAGADGLAHMVRNPGPDRELIDLILDNDVFVFTSLGIEAGFVTGTQWLDEPWVRETVTDADCRWFRGWMAGHNADTLDYFKHVHTVAAAALCQMHEAGVRLLLSADTGLMSQFFGIAEHRELEAMVRAGMPALEAIRAATVLPAQLLGLDDRGLLAPGKRADLLVLNGDPSTDICKTRDIDSVYLAGERLPRERMRLAWV